MSDISRSTNSSFRDISLSRNPSLRGNTSSPIAITGNEMASTKRALSGQDSDDLMALAAAGAEDLWRIARFFKGEMTKIDECAFEIVVDEEKLGRRFSSVERNIKKIEMQTAK